MRPVEFTPEAIIEAGQELQGAGRNITGFALRQKVGGGNPTRLKQVWDEHLASQSVQQAEPARVYLRVSTDAQDLERQEGHHHGRQGRRLLRRRHLPREGQRRTRRPARAAAHGGRPATRRSGHCREDRPHQPPTPARGRSASWPRYRPRARASPFLAWSIYPSWPPSPEGVPKIVLEAVQDMLLKLALQMARDDYETGRERQRQGIEQAKAAGKYRGSQPDEKRRAQVLALRSSGHSINRTAELTGFSASQVKRICAQ
jgi:hypothetical protein